MDISLINNYANSISFSKINQNAEQSNSFKNILDEAVTNADKEALKNACIEFESYFINLMFKEMRKTVSQDQGIFQKSHAEKIFQEMLDEEYTKNAANSGGVGLADMMYKQLARNL